MCEQGIGIEPHFEENSREMQLCDFRCEHLAGNVSVLFVTASEEQPDMNYPKTVGTKAAVRIIDKFRIIDMV
jgi:hypothetical protein